MMLKMSFLLTKKWYKLWAILIILLALGLRLYQLGKVPAGMTWDEAAIGYNGYAILETGRDEWLQKLPVSFRSFGDYKAPLAIYLNGIFTFALGMNLTAVRVPFVIGGVLAVWGMMLLTLELTKNQALSLAAGWLLALSPWHLHFSRAGFESGLALTMIIWGSYFFFKFINSKTSQLKTSLYLLGSVVMWAASLYTYHSTKVFVPLFGLVLLIKYRQLLWERKKVVAVSGGLGLVLVYPLIKDALVGHGLERAGVTIFDSLNGSELIITLLRNLWLHLSPAFLIFGETTTLRHGPGTWGVLLPTTLLLVIVGSYYLIKTRRRLLLFAGGWIFIGLVPAVIGSEVPHSNRALLALPGFIILAVTGFDLWLKQIHKWPLNQKIKSTRGQANQIQAAVIGLIFLAHGLFFLSYQQHYYKVFAKNSADDFKEGYLDALTYVRAYEEQVDKIIFADDYGQPYIYALFVRKTNPIWYQGGSLHKYEFTNQINLGDLLRPHTIVVASGADDLPTKAADRVIYGSDGSIRFKIYLPTEIRAAHESEIY